jgi:hypothetical protein
MNVHERAAQKTIKRKRRKNVGNVTSIKVHPLVWAEALRLARGNFRRIVIIDSEHVIIRNHPRPVSHD